MAISKKTFGRVSDTLFSDVSLYAVTAVTVEVTLNFLNQVAGASYVEELFQ